MSIQDSDGQISYADHDVHHIYHRALVLGGTGGDDFSEAVTEEFEVTERGLDPDELAELRAMRVSIGAQAAAGQAQDSRGEFSFTVNCGFNIGPDDALSVQQTSKTALDPDSDATDELQSATIETDEVGQIYTFAGNYGIGFDDDANGNGAGGQSQVNTETLDFSGMFGSGPYVDAADDFVSVIGVKPDNVIEEFGVIVQYSLYYDVNQTEGGRSRFGR